MCELVWDKSCHFNISGIPNRLKVGCIVEKNMFWIHSAKSYTDGFMRIEFRRSNKQSMITIQSL